MSDFGRGGSNGISIGVPLTALLESFLWTFWINKKLRIYEIQSYYSVFRFLRLPSVVGRGPTSLELDKSLA
jgi:hypothetical protein